MAGGIEKTGSRTPPLIQLMEVFDNDKNGVLQDLLAFNETFQTVQYNKDFLGQKAGKSITDTDVAMLRWHITKANHMCVLKHDLEDVLIVQSQKKIINPVKDWLNNIKWDGTPRLDNWLHDYIGCRSNTYTKEAGKMCLLAAVSRVFEPGIKFDSLLIIEGNQGVGKSRLVEALGGKWYLDMSVKENDKDIVDEMRGAWIIEISELAGFSKKDVDWLKAFLSRKTDRCRLSYGRRSQDYPRQSIFIGTMNPSGDNTYLKDDTGNRRFLPVLAGKINVEKLAKDRDQIFAEAVAMYQFGNTVLYLTGEADNIAKKEQEIRLFSDPWLNVIIKGTNMFPTISMPEIMDILGLHAGHRGTFEAIRIGRIMKKLGWERHQKATGERYYIRKKEASNDNEQEGTTETHESDSSEGRVEQVGQENGSDYEELGLSQSEQVEETTSIE